jgi:glycosyltransferase involved in cell wall biosynthesis
VLVVLDDGSTDDTAARVQALQSDPRLRLVGGGPLPPGWAGKAHACAQLATAAHGEWLLFLDADTSHEPDLVARAMSDGVESGADLLSSFPRQEIGSVGEALTVPFIYWVLFTLLPIRGVWERPEPALVAACGQLLLARRSAYEATGGHSAIAGSLHDGLHLARLFKSSGRMVRLADLSPWVRCRMYRGSAECWNGFTRNAYQAIGSPVALAFIIMLEALLFAAPFGFLLMGVATEWPLWSWIVLAQALVLLGIQVSLRQRFGYPWLTVALHPIGVAALIAIQVASALRSLTGRAGEWKGRSLARQERRERRIQ